MKKILKMMMCFAMLFSVWACDSKQENHTKNDVVETITFIEMVDRIVEIENDGGREVVKNNLITEKLNNQNFMSTHEELDTQEDVLDYMQSLSYKAVEISIPAVNGYEPEGLEVFFTESKEESEYMKIDTIEYVNLNRRNKKDGNRKGFWGNVYINKENGDNIHWIIDGEFYESDNTKKEVEKAENQYVSINYKCSTALESFAAYNNNGDFKLPKK